MLVKKVKDLVNPILEKEFDVIIITLNILLQSLFI
jgi:hypothetical protein